MSDNKWKKIVQDGLLKTINKFRENPITFFNEYDAHCYFYKQIYSKELIVHVTYDGINLFVPRFHQEYPTIYSYSGEKLNKIIDQEINFKDGDDYKITDNISISNIIKNVLKEDNEKDKRGNSDFVLLKESFIKNRLKEYFESEAEDFNPDKIYEIISRKKPSEDFVKNNQDLIIEMKFVNTYSMNFTKEVVKDFFKLGAVRETVKDGNGELLLVNLVFCNLPDFSSKVDSKTSEKQKKRIEWVRDITIKDDIFKGHNILGIFVQSYFHKKGKSNKEPKTNVPDKGWKEAIVDYFK